MTTELPETRSPDPANTPLALKSNEGLGPLPAGLLTVESRAGIAHAGGMRRYEPIQALPDGEHKLYTQGALDAAVAAERKGWAKVLAESCADERSQLWEAGPGGGCSRAIEAESELAKLRAALIAMLDDDDHDAAKRAARAALAGLEA